MRRQKSLEQSIQSAQETDKTLRLIQESLAAIDKQLTAYTADRVDAAQVPQEAQVSYTHVELVFTGFLNQPKSVWLSLGLSLKRICNMISMKVQVNFVRDYFEKFKLLS